MVTCHSKQVQPAEEEEGPSLSFPPNRNVLLPQPLAVAPQAHAACRSHKLRSGRAHAGVSAAEMAFDPTGAGGGLEERGIKGAARALVMRTFRLGESAAEGSSGRVSGRRNRKALLNFLQRTRESGDNRRQSWLLRSGRTRRTTRRTLHVALKQVTVAEHAGSLMAGRTKGISWTTRDSESRSGEKGRLDVGLSASVPHRPSRAWRERKPRCRSLVRCRRQGRLSCPASRSKAASRISIS